MPRTKIEAGQTWYHKTAHYPVKIESHEKISKYVLTKDASLSFTGTKGLKVYSKTEFRKTFEPMIRQ